ncbi:SLAC1 anion channel family protein [Maritimibacter sp. UBA3975]|uniref:SLAC1 anion channel family protein n=1 Tax=Maritimibacter sp. UBA3975 TaxID=1946833 RepID=UPI000C09A8F2|nr:SLAC1 anion channel family protein [Maritimibacter sp. UBA3975]MAM60482.1 C4-dicarboxylate ABC transporter [Maritimibacter sp.]|tara:strand:- start:5861 stop:6838 length:978 start_codon:yes stop_codon:yes gene_type:complete
MTDATETLGTHSRLEHFPVTFFAIVMGLLGVTLAFHAATPVLGWTAGVSLVALWGAIGAFVMISAIYLAKVLRYPGAVAGEWNHPVKLAFFPTMTISLLLLATALREGAPSIAEPLWMIGAVGQGILTIAVVTGWISHRSFEVGHLTPAWFIPAVGNVIVPVAGARMGYIEISWLFFSVGMMFWGVLLTLVMNRLVFHDPIPARLFPTMVILIAPPSVAFVAYVTMSGVVDGFARSLIYVAYLFAALVVAQVPRLARLPFALSWWALSFPLAALTIASLLFARLEETAAHQAIGLGVLVILSLVVVGLIYRTTLAILRGEICNPE